MSLLGLGLVPTGAGSLAGFAGGAGSVGVVVALVVVGVGRVDRGNRVVVLRRPRRGGVVGFGPLKGGGGALVKFEEEVLGGSLGEGEGSVEDIVGGDAGGPNLEHAVLGLGVGGHGQGLIKKMGETKAGTRQGALYLLEEGGGVHGAGGAGGHLSGLRSRGISRGLIGRGLISPDGGLSRGPIGPDGGRRLRSGLETSQVLVAGIVTVLAVAKRLSLDESAFSRGLVEVVGLLGVLAAVGAGLGLGEVLDAAEAVFLGLVEVLFGSLLGLGISDEEGAELVHEVGIELASELHIALVPHVEEFLTGLGEGDGLLAVEQRERDNAALGGDLVVGLVLGGERSLGDLKTFLACCATQKSLTKNTFWPWMIMARMT